MTQAIEPIDYQSSYRLAADQIRRAIELGMYLPGDRLPASREFAFQLGISVATLREAVRGLIDEGLLEMRRGPKGGLVVLPPPSGRRRRITKAVMVEVERALELRRAVEGESARLAAERRTNADLKRLQRSYDAMVEIMAEPEESLSSARFNRADSSFHTDIARASGNELLVAAVEDARLKMFASIGVALSGPLTRDANDGHDAILSEIRRGRPEAAAKAARRHVDRARKAAQRVVSRRG